MASARRWRAGWGLALCLSVTGCSTLLPEPRQRTAHERQDFILLREEIRRIEGRLEGLEMETERLRAEAEDLRRRQDGQHSSLREMNAAFERRLNALDSARQKDRQEIVDGLSRQMTELLQPRRPTGPRSGGAETGYEHEVRPGETLSTIASAYGVRIQTIQEANQIADPNRLRAGQVLFIPAP